MDSLSPVRKDSLPSSFKNYDGPGTMGRSATLRIMNTLRLTAEAPRCWWCGQKLTEEPHHIHFEVFGKPYDTAVCSPTHEQAVTAAYRYIHRVFPVFWAGIALSIALLVGSNFVRWSTWFVAGGLITMGITLLLCPFVTPQTVELVGLKRSLTFGRVAGLLFLLSGLGLAIAILLK